MDFSANKTPIKVIKEGAFGGNLVKMIKMLITALMIIQFCA